MTWRQYWRQKQRVARWRQREESELRQPERLRCDDLHTCIAAAGGRLQPCSLPTCTPAVSSSRPTARSAATAGSDPDVLPQQMLRKYITYAKQTCRPKLQAADYDKIAKVGAAAGNSGWCSGEAVVPVRQRLRRTGCQGFSVSARSVIACPAQPRPRALPRHAPLSHLPHPIRLLLVRPRCMPSCAVRAA